MKRVLTCLGMMSVLLLTFTVSSGFVSNGYHKAYARGDLDALGTKIRESINNQVTEELSGSGGPNPSPSSGSSPTSSSLSPSSGSSGLTTSSPTPTILTLSVAPSNREFCTLSGTLKTDTGSPVGAATITFTGFSLSERPVTINEKAETNGAGAYSTATSTPRGVFCVLLESITAHYAGAAAIPANAASKSGAIPVPP